MDSEQFDTLIRVFAAPRSRRAALGALVGTCLLGCRRQVLAESSKAPGKGHNKDRTDGQGNGHEASNGQGHEDDGLCRLSTCQADPRTGEPAFCCKDGSCSCGGKCCGDSCFQRKDPVTGAIAAEFCCSGPTRLASGALVQLVYCPNVEEPLLSMCCPEVGAETCRTCLQPSGIAGTYRRPGR